MRHRRVLAVLCAAGALAATAAGCGGSHGAASSAQSNTIRFVFADDPVWDYMTDHGIVQQMEKQYGFKVKTLESDDELGLFAGGHADIVSTGSYETPLYDAKGVPTVTFGKYNMNKDLLITANPKWKSAKDLPKGCKVAAESTTGNTIIWKSLIKKLDGRDLSENGDDLKISTADYQIMPTLVAKGSVCAAISDPTQVTKDLRLGRVHGMYGGKPAAQLYGERIVPGHMGVTSNDFVARKAWFDNNPKAVAFFLKLWQRGLNLWKTDREKIIEQEPNDFAVQTPADIAFMKKYSSTGPFSLGFVDSVYLTKDWIDGEKPVFDLIKAAGEIPKDLPYNEHVVVDQNTGKPTLVVGGSGQ